MVWNNKINYLVMLPQNRNHPLHRLQISALGCQRNNQLCGVRFYGTSPFDDNAKKIVDPIKEGS